MLSDSDLDNEQDFIDNAWHCLDAMRKDAEEMLNGVINLGKGGTFQSRTERDIVVRTSLQRLSQLEIGNQALCFGRIDHVASDEFEAGESYHIGRLAVSGPDHEPLVVDWRAPVAAPFYSATGLDPQGLFRRRHLALKGQTVVGIEDEYFAQTSDRLNKGIATCVKGGDNELDNEAGLNDDSLVIGGPGALLATLSQARTGRMGDIVSTIQKEQDEIIRYPLSGLLVVQGGPGTGKTAVALHRAAYLLYTHRFPLERQGVLVVGPNPLFLRYIEQVLPSLGEGGVTLSTVAGLVPEIKVRGLDEPRVARLKGEIRMIKVIANAIKIRERPLRYDLEVPFGVGILRLSRSEMKAIIDQAQHRPGTHNGRRRFVEQRIARKMAVRYRARYEGIEQEGDERTEAQELAALCKQILKLKQVREALERMWPRLHPHELIHDLLGSMPILKAASKGILTSNEVAMISRERSLSLNDVKWTDADAALVDEARNILGPRASRQTSSRGSSASSGPDIDDERALDQVGFWPAGLSPSPLPQKASLEKEGLDVIRSYGHIVVDEIQDLSPLELRMISRRSLSGSMTVVGDLGQASGPFAPTDWSDITQHLSSSDKVHFVELTVSYRTPAEVMEAASKVLALGAPALRPPVSVRRSGHQPVVLNTTESELAGLVARVAIREAEFVSPGRTAILGPAPLLPEVMRAIQDLGVEICDPRNPEGEGLGSPLVILPADEANGLEFDSVIVVEPGLIARDIEHFEHFDSVGDEGPSLRGMRTLYVALTRPTNRLTVIHAQELPVDLVRK